ncbi:TPA: hypothetical protein ACH3X2_009303 [Trebouxia sp. C0005]
MRYRAYPRSPTVASIRATPQVTDHTIKTRTKAEKLISLFILIILLIIMACASDVILFQGTNCYSGSPPGFGMRESCSHAAEDNMKQALASGLIITQQKVISNPPTFVKITKKYQRRASTPALSNSSSLTNSVSGVAGRAGSPEVSSSNQSGGSASGSAGSLGVQDFMNSDILKTAKLWRFQKLIRGELVDLVLHYTRVTPSVTATKAQLIKSLMDVAVGLQ